MVGNAKQLENEIKRLMASVRGTTISEEDLDLPREQVQANFQEKLLSLEGKSIDEAVENIER